MSTVSASNEWRRRGLYALLLFTVVVWGASFVAARMVLSPLDPSETALTPTMLATVRFLIASAIFLPILCRQHLRVQPIMTADLPLFLLLGQLGISSYFWLQYTGVQLTNAGIAAVLVVGLIPLATMIASRLALHEALSGHTAIALATGALGVVVVASQRGLGLAADTGFLAGTVCLVANAVVFAVYSVLIRGIRARYDSLTLTGAMMVAGTIGLVLLAVATEDLSRPFALSGQQWGAILFLAGVCSVLAYFFYNYALTQMHAARAAAWLYLEPVVAVLLGAWMLGELITIQTVAGGALILGSLLVSQRK